MEMLGRPMSVKVLDARMFSADDAIKMKFEADLSDRQLFVVLRCIRATFGKASIPK